MVRQHDIMQEEQNKQSKDKWWKLVTKKEPHLKKNSSGRGWVFVDNCLNFTYLETAAFY